MLYYVRVDVSDGVGVNKSIVAKECIFCHY